MKNITPKKSNQKADNSSDFHKYVRERKLAERTQHQQKTLKVFKQAIEEFDEAALLKRGMHPKQVKAMKAGLVSQYEELKQEIEKKKMPPHVPAGVRARKQLSAVFNSFVGKEVPVHELYNEKTGKTLNVNILDQEDPVVAGMRKVAADNGRRLRIMFSGMKNNSADDKNCVTVYLGKKTHGIWQVKRFKA